MKIKFNLPTVDPSDLLASCGWLLLVIGVSMINLAYGLIVGGLILLVVGIVSAYR